MSKTSASYRARIAQHIDNKLEVTNLFYLGMLLATLLVVSCNSVFNATYGYTQGADEWGRGFIAFAYLMGDWALCVLAGLLFPRWLSRVFGWFAVPGLIFLSIFAATGYLISQQYAVDGTQITQLRDSIEQDKRAYEKYQKLVTAQRIERKQGELRELIAQKGESGASAIYAWIGSAVNKTPQTVSLVLRIFWSTIFVLTGICLSGYLKGVYCSLSLKLYSRLIIGNLKSTAHYESKYEEVREEVASNPISTKQVVSISSKATFKQKLAQARKLILSGELEPSYKALEEKLNITTKTVKQILNALQSEGVLYRKGKFYRVSEEESEVEMRA